MKCVKGIEGGGRGEMLAGCLCRLGGGGGLVPWANVSV